VDTSLFYPMILSVILLDILQNLARNHVMSFLFFVVRLINC
jgi:hypothetical protein